ncbi:MAG: hypothetical protein JSV21_06015 [Nitrospirota bacterium]|nr:MAG: hypothetical protein JSV21_06015 [Nitrospirota bacterium]
MRKIHYLFLMTLFASLYSCAGVAPADRAKSGPDTPSFIEVNKEVDISFEEQQKLAFEKFNEILEVSQEGDRLDQLGKMAGLYIEIINEYPDAHLAQESCMRLISLYLIDYNPPKEKEAIELDIYHRSRYPDSPLRNAIEDTVMRYFYKKGEWKELQEYVTPHIKDFIKTGELRTPVHLFYYSEAKFNLNDYKEAYKGYKIIIKRFPKSRDTSVAVKRIGTIKMAVEMEKRNGK